MQQSDLNGVKIHGKVHRNGRPVLLTPGWRGRHIDSRGGVMNRTALRVSLMMAVAIVCSTAAPESVRAEPVAPAGVARSLPFNATLSNNLPLAFGMNVENVARALGTRLDYVSGRPGDEIYLAFRDIGGSGLFPQRHRLYLQFRKGRLAGWKGDWGHNWMWQ